MNIEVSGELNGIELKRDTLEGLARYIEKDYEGAFTETLRLVHLKSVFQILTRLIMITPVDTGRLRGSWTKFMNAKGNTSWAEVISNPPLGGGQPRKTPKKGFSQEAVQAGAALGDFVDNLLDTTITTNVNYASFVEARQSFVAAALAYGDVQYNKNVENFLEATARTGLLPKVDPNART